MWWHCSGSQRPQSRQPWSRSTIRFLIALAPTPPRIVRLSTTPASTYYYPAYTDNAARTRPHGVNEAQGPGLFASTERDVESAMSMLVLCLHIAGQLSLL